ncbi:Breast carcinoma-amplified sequence 3 like [Pseudolycoriella hygida]|uniref:Breast carcinoma-amplified sequence 3 like n=1 Tax=Pseudolycoriella hygida TaxID=35572 RepID=A0A9Q0MWB2_9DIPT|nr:Breast carcinoma-amplified sequence 3 like [Pseudolycoriella hygida]
MSAVDSPKRSARSVPSTVPPQAVSDRTLLESVTGFINEVALTNIPQTDPKDAILWARFETAADVTDSTFGDDWDLEGGVAPPLLLLLGYGTGVQVWAIPANGEAVEVLSWRHGSVRALRILPLPITSTDENGDDVPDIFAAKRPLMAICDANTTGSGPQFCSVNFISLRDGDQVKSIKFKNPILDILGNRSVIVITFAERIAVFDAKTLDDRLTVTTCHPGTNFSPNPVALGTRWLAYAERKLLPSKRSSGGCDGDGVASYKANILNAAKSLGKGLLELGEQMAAGFTGTNSSATLTNSSNSTSNTEDIQPGVVTIMDTKYSIKENSPTTGAPISISGTDPIIAHFVAHSEAIVALAFDCSGMLLASADRRGHDFHVFRIQSHPSGPSLSAVHHLYILHRGDTTAKVQDIAFSLDSRWIAVSTLRGTTHVFPVTPYGGAAGVRTHGSPHVVNRLSRFHRSAGLDARANSPVHSDGSMNQISNAYNNPRVPPFPHPLIVLPLAQLRQPTILGISNHSQQAQKTGQSRQRLTSLGDDQAKPLRVCATFAKARAWLLEPPGASRDMSSLRMQRKAVDSLFIVASHGALIQYDLEPKHNSNIPKDKVCDDTAIELEVEPKAQWNLLRKECSNDSIQPPVPSESWLLKDRLVDTMSENEQADGDRDDRWLSQVEIITHAGPHRRLWMGPQFMFKTYNTLSGAPLSHIDSEAVEVGINNAGNRPARSNPMNMPLSGNGRSPVPVLIESGSCSSYEHSPRLVDQYRHNEHMGSDFSLGAGDSQLREDLADAMRESPGGHSRDSGLPSSSSSATRSVIVSIAKVVNPLGTVTTLTQSVTSDSDLDYGYVGDGDEFIHENCDEALFRPVVAVFGGSIGKSDDECHDRPNDIGQELIVPVIEKKNVIESRIKAVQENAAVDKIKKEKIKKEPEEKFKEPEKKERKKSDSKPPKFEAKLSGKKAEKTRKGSVSKTEEASEEIELKSDKSNKKLGSDSETTNIGEPETVVVKLPKKSQKKIAKLEEQRREITPPKTEEVDANVVKTKPRKISARSVEVDAEQIKETKNETKDSEKIRVDKQIEVPTSPSIEEAAKVKDEEKQKLIPQERISKKQPDKGPAGAFRWKDEAPSDSEEINEKNFEIFKRCKKQKKTQSVPDRQVDIDIADTSADYMEILNEELRSINADCSNIQESLFKDPVVATTFTVKKTGKKPSFTDVVSDSTCDKSPSSTKSTSYDLSTLEADKFSDVFAPLLPFDIDFEQLTFKDTTEEPISLINFESPSQDLEKIHTSSTITPTLDQIEKEKLVFALCGSLHCDDDDDDTLPLPPPPLVVPPLEGQDSDYKSLELDIDETYLSFEFPAPLDTTKDVEANSSDEDSSSQCKANKGEDGKYKAGMDEELQPLIGLTISGEHFDVAKEDEALPVEEEDDTINQIDVLKQALQMPEKQGVGNKKKSKKKRR